jgi:hypothetical protein
MNQFVEVSFRHKREKGDEKGRRGKCVFRTTNRSD